jgi:hypothetical protein
VEDGILLKPVACIARENAGEKVREVLGRAHAKLPPATRAYESRKRTLPASSKH